MNKVMTVFLWVLGIVVILAGIMTAMAVFQNQFALESLVILIVVALPYYFLSKWHKKKAEVPNEKNNL